MTKLKIICVLVVLTFFTNVSYAQLRVGATGGVVLSSLIRDSNLNSRAGTVGYLVGATAKYNVGDLGWFFQSGVNYTLEGDNDQSLNFVKIPLTIGLDASDDVNINVTYYLAWQVGNENNVQDFYYEKANMLGLGFEVYLSDKFALGTKLNYGLSNLVSDPAGAKNYTIKPFTLDIYLTYFLK